VSRKLFKKVARAGAVEQTQDPLLLFIFSFLHFYLFFVFLVVGVLPFVAERWKIRTQEAGQDGAVVNVVAP
jgi:hypothetical protein